MADLRCLDTSCVRDPAAGTRLGVRAGSRIDVELTVAEVGTMGADRALKVGGLPESTWSSLPGTPEPIAARAEGDPPDATRLKLSIHPPSDAVGGDYAFLVSICDYEGSLPTSALPLILRVEPCSDPEPRGPTHPSPERPETGSAAYDPAGNVGQPAAATDPDIAATTGPDPAVARGGHPPNGSNASSGQQKDRSVMRSVSAWASPAADKVGADPPARAITLVADRSSLTMGPWASTAEFALQLDNAGKADIAVRLDAFSDRSDTRPMPVNNGTDRSSPWQWTLDREWDLVRASSHGLPPGTAPVRARVRRNGIWWLGLWETSRIRITAAPIREESDRPAAHLHLTARRWRLLPFPAPCLLPLLLIAGVLALKAPSGFTVRNAEWRDPSGAFWVVGPAGSGQYVTLDWNALPFVPVYLDGHGGGPSLQAVRWGAGSVTERLPADMGDGRTLRRYRLKPALGAAESDLTAVCITTRDDASLTVSTTVGDAEGRAPARLQWIIPDITLRVPPTGSALLELKSSPQSRSPVHWWMVQGPGDRSPFEVEPVGNAGVVAPGATLGIRVSRRNGARTGARDQLSLATTAADHPLLRVLLVAFP